MPRYWTGWGMTGSFTAGSPRTRGPQSPAVLRLALLASHDERAAGRGHGPAEVHRDLGVLDLAALARGIVVRVDALGGARTVVVHGAAELAHVLDHHGHAVRVALAEVAARRVVGARAPELDDPARHVGAALALLAEPVLLQLEHGGEREGVVGAGDVDVLGRDPGRRKDNVLGVVAGHPRDGAIRPMEVQARLRDAPGDAHDIDGPVLQVARTFDRRDDDARRVVRLDAAVEEMERLDDPARVEDVRHRHALLQERLRGLRGVLAVRDAHVRDLRGGRAVLVHVAHEGRREVLAGAPHPVGHLREVQPAHGLGGARPGATDAELRVSVHRAVDCDGIAHARFDRPHRQADQRLSGRAAPHHVHVEVEPDAEVGGHAVGERRVAALVVEHPVHVGRFEAGVEDRLADRLHGHGPRRAPRAARVLRLSDADDAVLVPEPATLDDHLSGASSIFWTLGLSPRYPAAARCYHFVADCVIGPDRADAALSPWGSALTPRAIGRGCRSRARGRGRRRSRGPRALVWPDPRPTGAFRVPA